MPKTPMVNIREFVRSRRLEEGPPPKPIPERIDLLNLPDPPQWTVQDFAIGGPTLIAGPANVGKSWLCMQLALCIASGENFLGRKVERPGPVIYWDTEDGKGEMGQRAREVATALDIDLAELTSRLHLFGGDPLTVGKGREWSELLDSCALHEPVAVLLDPAMSMLQGSPNANEDVSTFFNHLRHLHTVLGCAVIVTHHTPKGHANTPLGAQRWEGAPDVVILAMNGALRWQKIRGARGEMPAEMGVRFEQRGTGQCLVEDSKAPMRRLINAIERTGRVMLNDTGYRTLAEELRVDDFTTRKWVNRALNDGILRQDGARGSNYLAINNLAGLGIPPRLGPGGYPDFWDD